MAETPKLKPLGDAFEATRKTLHEVADKKVAAARVPENEISLRQTPGGFGTPWFFEKSYWTQVRVEGDKIVKDLEGNETIEQLDVDAAAARQLADWYAFSAAVLGRLMHECGEEAKAKDDLLLRMWPEHFDLAFDYATEAKDRAATYGASPGDETVTAPYLYVGPWKEREGELWNATKDKKGFAGAILTYDEITAAADQVAAALEFFRKRLWELNRP